MDRRDFLKAMFAAPLLTQLLPESKTSRSDLELYLIGDTPQVFIPFIMEEIKGYTTWCGRNFTFLNSHPQENDLERILLQRGWKHIQKPSQADLALSFSHLQHHALPSFTLVRDGKICDIRAQKLHSLWKEMNEKHKPSSCLTLASFKKRKSGISAGEFVSIYKDGRRIEMFPLKENLSKSFRAGRNKITVRLEGGKAWVSESSCRHKICLSSPPVSLAGERIICAPNHFLLEIQGRHSIDTSIG